MKGAPRQLISVVATVFSNFHQGGFAAQGIKVGSGHFMMLMVHILLGLHGHARPLPPPLPQTLHRLPCHSVNLGE